MRSDENGPAPTAPGYGDQGPAGAGRDRGQNQEQEDAAGTEEDSGGED